MRGEGLITNTIWIGIIIVAYYASMMMIGFLYDTFAGIEVIKDWSTNMPGPLYLLWNLVIYIIIPLCIVVAMVMRTRPREQYIGLGGI